MIESGIIGRPVFTISGGGVPRPRKGSIHFQHLLHTNGGLVRHASSSRAHRPGSARDRPRGQRAGRERRLHPGLHPARRAGRAGYAADGRRCAGRRRPPPGEPSSSRSEWSSGSAGTAAGGLRQGRWAECASSSSWPTRLPPLLRLDAAPPLRAGTPGRCILRLARQAVGGELEGLDGSDQRITVGGRVPKPMSIWRHLKRDLRWTTDFIRYLDERYADAHYLRGRVVRRGFQSRCSGSTRPGRSIRACGASAVAHPADRGSDTAGARVRAVPVRGGPRPPGGDPLITLARAGMTS